MSYKMGPLVINGGITPIITWPYRPFPWDFFHYKWSYGPLHRFVGRTLVPFFRHGWTGKRFSLYDSRQGQVIEALRSTRLSSYLGLFDEGRKVEKPRTTCWFSCRIYLVTPTMGSCSALKLVNAYKWKISQLFHG